MSSSSEANDAKTIARGAGVNILGEILGTIGPAFFVLVSRLLGEETLGIYILSTTYVALFLRLAVMGLDKGVMRHVPMAKEEDDPDTATASVLGTALRFSLCIAVALTLVALIAPEFLIKVGGDDGSSGNTAWWLAVLMISLPAQVAVQVMLYALRGLNNMWAWVVVNNVLRPGSLIVLSLLPLWFGFGDGALAFGYVSAYMLAAVVGFWLFRKAFSHLSLRRIATSKRDSDLIQFAWPQGLTELLNYLLSRADIVMIAAFFPGQPELVAFYGVASLIASQVKKVRQAFDNSFSPVLAKLYTRGEKKAMQGQYRRVARWTYTLYLALAGGITFFSGAILAAFGASYVDYWIAVPMLAGGRLINAAAGPAQTALLMSGNSRLEFLNNLAINIVNVGLNFLLIPMYDVLGAAMATTTALTLFNVARYVEIRKLLELSVSWANVLRSSLAAGLAGIPGILAYVYTPDSILLTVAGGVAFLLLFPIVLIMLGAGDDVGVAWTFLSERYRKWRQKENRPGDLP